MISNSPFAQFAKTSVNPNRIKEGKIAVVYTRVSSKEQADKNLSLDFQKKVIDEYVNRNGFTITEYFGGTYESAKTDGRKEFQRMLDFIKKNSGKVSHIIVYTLDRFSRTGGGAIKLAEELREKYGVTVFAVTQPADTSNPSGVLQQNIHFIFSQYDNQLRKQRSVAGMKEKFEKGIWVAKPPIGYDILRTNGERKIIINSTGLKIKKAFIWKGDGMKNEAILDKLKSMGLKLYKQHLTKILCNPFYCGIITHKMLDGKVIEGNQEKLISKELFLKVNEIHQNNSGYGISHKSQQDELPLKVFIKCDECNQPFTGYVVKAKGLWYYKCRTKGCKCNKSAKEIHLLFQEFLSTYNIRVEFKEPLLKKMEAIWNEINKESTDVEESYNKQLVEVAKQIDEIAESRFIKKEMNQETYDKFLGRFEEERKTITKNLKDLGNRISNPVKTIEVAIDLATKLATTWDSSHINRQGKLQKLLFPNGIVYDRKNRAFRTEKVNSIFELMSSLTTLPDKNERRQTGDETRLSPCVPPKGLPTVQWDMYTAEDIGFEKFDILSQRGIGHIKECAEIVKANRGIKIDVHEVEKFKKDKQVQQQLKSGNSIGCFYIKSPAMRGLLKKLKCEDYITLVAASSIIRPGVAKSGMMKAYIERFHDPTKVQYLHPVMEQQLKETFGVMVYQEDVLKVGHHFGGLDLADADVLRRMMSGKGRNKKHLLEIEQKYYNNCKEFGYPEAVAKEVWRQIESFAGYSFSKAHSASFAVESFQSLYLKTYYPIEFMNAVINNFGGFYSTRVYVNEAQKAGATIHLPCVNNSNHYTLLKGTDLYLGFIHIKDLEGTMAQLIPQERVTNGDYASIENFVLRTKVTLEQLIILIRIGSFRFTGLNKKTLLWEAHVLLNKTAKPINDLLFTGGRKTFTMPKFETTTIEDAYDEIELLGFPITVNMFDMLQTTFRGETNAKELISRVGQQVRIVGNYIAQKHVRTVRSETMSFGTFIDSNGDFFDTTHFPPALKMYPFKGSGVYLILGKVVEEFGFPSIEVVKMAKLGIKMCQPKSGRDKRPQSRLKAIRLPIENYLTACQKKSNPN